MIKNHDSITQVPERNSLDLGVSTSGMTVTVEAGTFHLLGVSYELLEDQEYDALAGDVSLLVEGILFKDRATDQVELIVDEVEPGEPRLDVHEVEGHEFLTYLYWFSVPPGCQSLDDVEINVLRTLVEQEEEEENGESEEG